MEKPIFHLSRLAQKIFCEYTINGGSPSVGFVQNCCIQKYYRSYHPDEIKEALNQLVENNYLTIKTGNGPSYSFSYESFIFANNHYKYRIFLNKIWAKIKQLPVDKFLFQILLFIAIFFIGIYLGSKFASK